MAAVWDLIGVFGKVRTSQKLFADDSIDKLNRSFTVILLICTSVFILSKTYGASISCLDEGVKTSPVTMEYVNSLCWANGVFKLDDYFGSAIRNRTPKTIFHSYPWLPLIAIFLAFLFYSPYLIWKAIIRTNSYQHVPIDINGIIGLLKKSSIEKKNDFSANIFTIGAYLDRCFSLNNFQDGYLDEYEDFFTATLDNQASSPMNQPKKYKNRINKKKFRLFFLPLMIKYIFVKVLYLAISLSIFPLIDVVLQFKRHSFVLFGYEVINKIYISNNETYNSYITSQYFPRFVLCSLQIRDLSQIQTYSYQCALPANIFNEIIFLLLWAWFVVLIGLNTFSLLKWIWIFVRRRAIIKEILVWPFRYNYHIDKYVNGFVYDYLNSEGFLMLMLIRSNTQDWHCRILVRVLWKLYMNRFNEQLYDEQSNIINNKQQLDSNDLTSIPINADMTTKVNFRRPPQLEMQDIGRTPVKINGCKNNFKSSQDF